MRNRRRVHLPSVVRERDARGSMTAWLENRSIERGIRLEGGAKDAAEAHALEALHLILFHDLFSR